MRDQHIPQVANLTRLLLLLLLPLVHTRPIPVTAHTTTPLSSTQSKAAVAHMARSCTAERGSHSIRVNALSPGCIQTPVDADEEVEARSKEGIEHVPLGRVAKPEEFRCSVVWKASEVSSSLTGASVVVDGGYTVW
ncbi:hypothetical protein BJ546DRAFT_899578 [Cryomyces antarcticus]